MVVKTLNTQAQKIILAINKVDVATAEQRQETIDFFKAGLGDKIIATIDISALKKDGIQQLLNLIKKQLPISPFIYDPDELTDVFERDITTELIQEAVFGSMRKEIPHGVMVKIDTWKEDTKKIRIDATIHTDRDAHRKIIVGKNGEQLNRIRKHAVQKIRDNIEKRIDLRLFVKVSPDWRNRQSMLEEFGFEVN
jgi:GTP-binding protein Era